MRTALFSFTYLTGNDAAGVPRLQRAQNFLRYYAGVKLGVSQTILSDNGSSLRDLRTLGSVPEIIYNPELPRGKGLDYLPCWRQQYDVKYAIDLGFDKIIVLDDDAYLLSDRIIKYVNMLNSGWTTFWCPKYQFPECAAHILCRDAFPLFLDFIKTPYAERNGTLMERALPFTYVNNNFNCDRYGETRAPQLPEMDGYFQCPGDIILKAQDAP